MATMEAASLPVVNDAMRPEIQESALPNEKQDYDDIKEKDDGYRQTTLDIQSVDQHYIPGDPLPLDENIPEEDTQFTIRAVFV